MRKHVVSFRHAFEGIFYNLRTQPNFRFHLLAATIATIVGLWLKIKPTEWLILVFTFMMVIVAEMINTAIESLTDLVSPGITTQAKIAKDTAAGMVLMTAIGSLIIGAIIFLPHLI